MPLVGESLLGRPGVVGIAFRQVTQLCGVCLPQTFDFLPAVPAAISPFLTFGIALLVSAGAADVLFRTRRVPRVATYIILGMAFGGPGLKWVSPDMAGLWRPAVDVALGAVLFRLGQRLDLAWLRHNKWLAASSLFEALATFCAVYLVMTLIGVPPVSSALVAAVAMSTSPAVTISLVMEAQSRGQVTERLLLLTGLNTIFALMLAQAWIGWGHLEFANRPFTAVLHPLYALFSSALLGLVVAGVYKFVARYMSNAQDVGLAHLSLVLVGVEAAYLFNVSPFLSLLGAGVVYRLSAGEGPRPAGGDGALLHPLQAFLFLVVGASANWGGFLAAAPACAALVMSRGLAKISVPVLLSRPSGLALRQGLGLGLGLLPMSALACLLTFDASALFPAFDERARVVLLGTIAVFQLVGPLLARLGLGRLSGECRPA